MELTKMTITEALAEVKTLGKRLVKKRQFIQDYLARRGCGLERRSSFRRQRRCRKY